MSKLFIYYSKTGNGDLIANKYQENGYDIIKLEVVHQLPKNLFMQMMIGGMFAFFNKQAKLKKKHYDLSSYDEIVIGTPVWNGNAATPFNTLIKNNDFKTKKVRIVAYSGSGFASNLTKRKLPWEITNLAEVKKHPEELSKLKF